MAERIKPLRYGTAADVDAALNKARQVVKDLVLVTNRQAEELRVARERLDELERRQHAMDQEAAEGFAAMGRQIAQLVEWRVEQEAKAKVKRVARRRQDGVHAVQ